MILSSYCLITGGCKKKLKLYIFWNHLLKKDLSADEGGALLSALACVATLILGPAGTEGWGAMNAQQRALATIYGLCKQLSHLGGVGSCACESCVCV